MVQWHNSFALHKPDAVCEFIGRQAWDRQALKTTIMFNFERLEPGKRVIGFGAAMFDVTDALLQKYRFFLAEQMIAGALKLTYSR
jgi:hypothetical protein